MTIDDIINAHNVVIPILGAIQPFTYAVKAVFVYPGKKQIEYAEKKGMPLDLTKINSITFLPTLFDIIYYFAYKASSYAIDNIGRYIKAKKSKLNK